MTDPADDPEEGEQEQADSAALDVTHVTTLEGPGFRQDLEQYAATRAEKHLDAAIDALADTLKKPGRYAKDRVSSAMHLINLALRRNPDAPGQASKVYVLDRGEAARVLAKRLGLPE